MSRAGATPLTRAAAPVAILVAAFLFNLGQGVLRPSLPLYLQHAFAANYRMVTTIPLVFGAGKWIAGLPTGYLLDRVGRTPLMVTGLLVLAACDVASALTSVFAVFLGLRGAGGIGWAMFGTVATTVMVDRGGASARGRAVSALLMSETLGLLLGTASGGWLYQGVGPASPFAFEAACMVLAALVVATSLAPATKDDPRQPVARPERHLVLDVLRVPGVLLMSVTSAALTAVQVGALVFLFPLYLLEHARVTPETVGYLVSVAVLGRLVALWLGGAASDRWGRPRVLTAGLVTYGTVLASLVLVTHPVTFGLWSAMAGAGAGFIASLPTAIVGDRVAPPVRGIAIGWLRMATDTGMLIGPLVMGAIADAAHLGATFVVAGIAMLVLALGCHRHAVRVAA